MDRIAVTARLRPGAEARALELLAAGPPFDPARAGLTRHTVYARGDTVFFVFEGEDLRRTRPGLVNDRLRSAAFAAWGPLLAEEPRLAHAAYHWDRKEETMNLILIAPDGAESAPQAARPGARRGTSSRGDLRSRCARARRTAQRRLRLGRVRSARSDRTGLEAAQRRRRPGKGPRNRRQDDDAARRRRRRDRRLCERQRRGPHRRWFARAGGACERAPRKRLTRRPARGPAAGPGRPRCGATGHGLARGFPALRFRGNAAGTGVKPQQDPRNAPQADSIGRDGRSRTCARHSN